MPTLQRRIGDGEYYIRHFHEHNTWQIVGDGVRILADRGISEGSHFSTDVLMDLWTRGLVYHGDHVPSRPPRPCTDLRVKSQLEQRMGEFYRLARAQQERDAWRIIATAVLAEEYAEGSINAAFDRFGRELRAMNLDRWRQLDVRTYEAELDVVQDSQSIFQATKVGAGLVRLWLRNASNSVEQRDVRHHRVFR